MSEHPTPWRIIHREAESESGRCYTLSWVVDANGHHLASTVVAVTADGRALLELIVRAVNAVAWLSPDTLAQLEEVGRGFAEMREAVTA